MSPEEQDPAPLGRREDQRLEFKGRETLDRPERVAREVVAMLNSLGGEVWIGLAEEEGVARRLEPVPEPEKQRDRLLDCFVERIEPRPTGDEVSVEVARIGSEPVLVVRVQTGARGPYALLHPGARAFLRRVGSRIVAMGREELARAFRGSDATPDPSELESTKLRVLQEGLPVIWMAAAVEPRVRLDLRRRELRDLLRNPQDSGNRISGCTVMTRFSESGQHSDRIWERLPSSAESKFSDWRLELRESGFLEWRARIGLLEQRDDPRTIHPYAILEYPTSFLRLFARILEQSESIEGRCTFDLLLLGIDGWRLWPYSPEAAGWKEEIFSQPPLEEGVLTFPRPLESESRELVENPDACAWNAVRWIYLEFGYTESEIPREFDRATKRLRFRD